MFSSFFVPFLDFKPIFYFYYEIDAEFPFFPIFASLN